MYTLPELILVILTGRHARQSFLEYPRLVKRTGMEQKVIIVKGKNIPPEEELAERLKELGPDWRVVSALTSMLPWGKINDGHNMTSPLHIFFATTVIVEKI